MNPEEVREEILEIIGEDSYSSEGLLIALSEKTGENRGEGFDDLTRRCLNELVEEGLVEKGKFYDKSPYSLEEALGVRDCYWTIS